MQQVPIMLPAGMNGTEQVVFLMPAPTQDRRPQRWNQCCAKGIGILFILIAVVAIACNIGWFFVRESLAPVGVGFWAGGLVLVTGVLMTVSGFRPSRGLIISVLVMSIVTNVFDTAFLTVGALQLVILPYNSYNYEGSLRSLDQKAMVGIGALYIAIGVVCFGLLLTASILSCVSLCSRSSARPTVAYLPQGMVIGQGATASQPLMQGAYYMQGAPVKVDQMPMNYAFAPQGSLPMAPPSYSL